MAWRCPEWLKLARLMMASADDPAKVAENNGDAGNPADFGTAVEPIAFGGANG